MERRWSGSRLLKRLVLHLPPEAQGPEEIAPFVAARVAEAGLWGARVVLGLGGERAYVRRLDFPFTSGEKIEQALPFEMEPGLPRPKEDLLFDARYVGRNSSGGSRVLAAALPQAEVGQWIQALREQGLDPARIDLSLSALAGLGVSVSRRIGASTVAVWHLGRSRSDIAVLRNGALVQTRSFRLGTTDLARMLAEGMDISEDEALQRMEQGVFSRHEAEDDGESPEGAPAAAKECVLLAHRELMRSVWALQNEDPEAAVEDVLLTGPGAVLPGLASALAAEGELRFYGVRETDLPLVQDMALSREELPAIAVAASLPLAEGRGGGGWNFRKGDFAYQGGNWRRILVSGGAGLGIVLLCSAAAFSFHVWLKHRELQEVRARTEEVFRETVPEASSSLQPAQYESVLRNRISSYREQARGSMRATDGLSPLDLLLFLSRSAPEEEGFRLNRLTMDGDEALLVGDAGSYDTVNRIREALLSEEGVEAVRIQGVTANRGEDTVRFTLRVEGGA
jgi:type IV pilus assembly protein PilM